MNNLLLLWQDPAAGGSNPLLIPFMLVGMGIIYFFIIRPQAKEQKAQQDFAGGLKKGSKVVTIGGLHGSITELKENEIGLLIAPKTIITVQRSSISLELTNSVYGNATSTKEPAKEKA